MSTTTFSYGSTRGIANISALGFKLLPLLLLLASLFPIWGMSHHLEGRNDDTYITLTYAKSLAAGEGWRYNGGTEALGTTTPLFALVVAGLARLMPAIPLAYLAIGWSTFCWIATAWCLFLGHGAFGLSRGRAAFVALVVLVQGGWWWMTLGMEATFLVFGLTFVTWLVARGNAFMSGVVSGLLFLIRPEGLAMVPLAGAWLVAYAWWQVGREECFRKGLRFALGSGLILGVWGCYAFVTFGAILPNSASAKLGQGLFWPGDPFVERLFFQWLPMSGGHYGLSNSLSLLWLLMLLGVVHAGKHVRTLLLLVVWVVVFLGAYAVLQAPGYWWYILPVVFVLHLLAALGLLFLFASSQRWVKGIGLLAALIFLGVTLNLSIKSVLRSQPDVRASTYLAAAEWLNTNTPPRSSVAFFEIGYLGYYSESRIVDLVGLVDPDLTENGIHLDLASNFWLTEPDYLLYNPVFDWLIGPIVQAPHFTEHYQLVADVPGHWGSPLMIYQRIDLMPPQP